jgi:hypothetical protein
MAMDANRQAAGGILATAKALHQPVASVLPTRRGSRCFELGTETLQSAARCECSRTAPGGSGRLQGPRARTSHLQR